MLREVCVEGYRVFKEPTKFILGQTGIICIAGKNNSGKSSAISLFNILKVSINFPNRNRFLSTQIQPCDSDSLTPEIKMKLSLNFCIENFSMTFPKLYKFILDSTPNVISVGEPRSTAANLIRSNIKSLETKVNYEFTIKHKNILHLTKICFNDSEFINEELWSKDFYFPWGISSSVYSATQIGTENGINKIEFRDDLEECFDYLAKFISSIYEIGPQRKIPSLISQQKPKNYINNELAEVTHILAEWKESNRENFLKVVNFLNEIDDSIGDIRFPAEGPNGERVVKFAKDHVENNAIITLKNSGSGISQLMGLVTHLLNYKDKFIVIDEPQAYLHPQAELSLLRLMRQSGHQIIIATHSQVFISAARENLIFLRKNYGQTTPISSLGTNNYNPNLFELSKELGVPANHLLAGHGILWFEGPTEISIVNIIVCFR